MPAGRLTVVAGPMFAGKSTELLRRVRRATLARIAVAIFKPAIDARALGIRSHDGLEAHALSVARAEAILEHLGSLPAGSLVAIDEAQFFDPGLVAVVQELVGLGYDVVAAGLDLDYRGEPFGPMPVLLALADEVVKLSAVCMVCGKPATRSQRLVNGQPAGLGPIVQIGSTETYEARCLDCWVSPHRVAAGTPAPPTTPPHPAHRGSY